MSQNMNHLVSETSPYLRQHAENPVDWWPWDEQALELAKRENKPILVSIGYSACHWCHVMAHESFEDVKTADLMNRLFVNIKIDREERPDLDKIYQQAHLLLTGQGGGWPLTIFLDPNTHIPFFSGTYFPPVNKFGLPSFQTVLVKLHEFYHDDTNKIKEQAEWLASEFKKEYKDAGPFPDFEVIEKSNSLLQRIMDLEYGGLLGHPKFPNVSKVERLLRFGILHGDSGSLGSALFTLKKMARGGIYDHIGGGFYRYSVDEKWEIPHFEKMLYDNALLLPLIAQAWQTSQETELLNTVKETASWMIDEMQSKEGGFYSALDADTSDGEGSYYIWSEKELQTILTKDEYAIFKKYFLSSSPNFEGKYHLNQSQLKLDEDPFSFLPESVPIKKKLIEKRDQRERPGLDNKIITAWNGMAIAGLAYVGRVSGMKEYSDAATESLNFILHTMYDDGDLLSVYNNGGKLNAYLDDYVYLLYGILEVLQCKWQDDFMDKAVRLLDTMLENFEDKDGGGFYFTGKDHEKMIHRPKPGMDETYPGGNGMAALILYRYGTLLGKVAYVSAAERLLQYYSSDMSSNPHLFSTMLHALEEMESGQTIILKGKAEDWQKALNRFYRPGRMVFAIPEGKYATDKKLQGDCCAYVCTGTKCLPPVTSFLELKNLFNDI